MLTQQQFSTLANAQGEHLISIYISTTPVGTEQRDAIELKNAVQKAKQLLNNRGLNDNDAESLLGKGNSLSEDFDFTNNSRNGLAVFISSDTFEVLPLGTKIEETSVMVGSHFMTGPLVAELNNKTEEFYLLTLSRHGCKLYLSRDGKFDQIDVGEVLTKNVEDALLLETPERNLNRTGRTNGAGEGTVHGYGAGKDIEKDHLKAYFDLVDRGVTTFLKNETRPLLLGGVDELIPVYQEANQYEHLITDVHISGNLGDVPTNELHQKATELIKGQVDEQKVRDYELFGLNMAKDEAGANLLTVVPAAINGRVAVLWVAKGASQYGRYEAATNGIEFSDDRAADAVELHTLAVNRAQLSGARVYFVDQMELPVPTTTICAIYRYAVDAQLTNLDAAVEA